MGGWAGLPPDILTTMMGRLNLADQVRTSAVCAAWRLVAMDAARRPPPLPALWLVLPQGHEADASPASFEFASFSEGMRRYSIGGEKELPHRYCVGSSEGWLMMVVEDLRELHAVNPITRDSMLLLSDGDHAVAPLYSYRKAIFVPPNGSGGAVTVAVLRSKNAQVSELVFARAATGGAWAAPEEVSLGGFEDIAAHEGTLYALGSDSRVVVFNLGCNPSSSSPPPPMKVAVIQTEPDRVRFHKKHLGVMAGDLVMLLWRYCRPCPFRLRRCVPEFQVFQLRTGREPKWVELEDLGGHCILLGQDGFTALPTREFPELRGNCVYSVVQTTDDDGARGFLLEVVDLHTRAVGVEPLCEARSAPVWFLPTSTSSTRLPTVVPRD